MKSTPLSRPLKSPCRTSLKCYLQILVVARRMSKGKTHIYTYPPTIAPLSINEFKTKLLLTPSPLLADQVKKCLQQNMEKKVKQGISETIELYTSTLPTPRQRSNSSKDNNDPLFNWQITLLLQLRSQQLNIQKQFVNEEENLEP